MRSERFSWSVPLGRGTLRRTRKEEATMKKASKTSDKVGKKEAAIKVKTNVKAGTQGLVRPR
jgi:hypothetical protein